MGCVRDRFGEVGVEARRESFYLRIGDPNGAFGDGEDDCKMIVYGNANGGGEVEIPYEHVDDVVAALMDLRDNDPSFKTWKEAKSP